MKIGDLRRSLFIPFDCKWNGLVRDVTAKRELLADEEVDEAVVCRDLLDIIREAAVLDRTFPPASRVAAVFAKGK